MLEVPQRRVLQAAGIVPYYMDVGPTKIKETKTKSCTPGWAIGDVVVSRDPDDPDPGLNDGQLLPHAMNNRVLIEILGGSFSCSGLGPRVVGIDNDVPSGYHITEYGET